MGVLNLTINLWEEEYDSYFKGELNAETLQKISEELNVELPESYIKLMTKRNGFYLKKRYFPTSNPNSWGNNFVQIDYLFGIGEDPGLLDSIYLRKEWGIRSKKLLIISAEPPIFICLDYRRKLNPSVVFIDVDNNQEIRLAKDFEEFINRLVDEIEENDEYPCHTPSFGDLNDYYSQIDEIIIKGKPKEIDRLFTKILSTNNELIRYMAEKMRYHHKPKVHEYLLLFLYSCAQGDNKGILEDHYVLEVLREFSNHKNQFVKALALASLNELKNRHV
jgi:hypothetical protein